MLVEETVASPLLHHVPFQPFHCTAHALHVLLQSSVTLFVLHVGLAQLPHLSFTCCWERRRSLMSLSEKSYDLTNSDGTVEIFWLKAAEGSVWKNVHNNALTVYLCCGWETPLWIWVCQTQSCLSPLRPSVQRQEEPELSWKIKTCGDTDRGHETIHSFSCCSFNFVQWLDLMNLNLNWRTC